MLNLIASGTASDVPPVLLAHGVFGNARNLGGLARRLEGRRVLQVDMRNHGESFWSDDHDYPALAADLAEVVATEGGCADVVGHSMGGKAAMVLALTRPGMVRRLVVLDIAPIAYGHTQTGLIDRMEAMDRNVTRRSEADAALAAAGVKGADVRGFLLQSLDLTQRPARWRMNLSVLRAAMATLTGWPADAVTPGAFTGPVLALAGAQSDYVDAAGAAALRHWFPQVDLRVLEGTGHWLHAERPEAVGDAVAAFLG